nr:hypothetical protein [uncultured Brevundimonas sp.]
MKVTPAHIAVAIVAACRITGVRADRAFEDIRGNTRTRLIAAGGCVARLGWRPLDAARLFQVDPRRLSPSMLTNARIFTDDLLAIAEALESHGLTDSAPKVAVFSSQPSAAEATPPARKAKAAAATGERRKRPADPPPAKSSVVREIRKGQPTPLREANPVRESGRRQAAPVRGAVRQLEPMNDRKRRFGRWFLDAGWSVDETAELFNVHPDALTDALNVAPKARARAA